MILPTSEFAPSVNADKYSVLKLILFNFAVFLPFIGHGFIHDDFSHLYSVVYEPLLTGLTKANGGPFYTPLAWLSFKVNWLLFGESAFFFALVNLLIHTFNTILLYFFAKKLWNSGTVAWWSAAGFALLFPANIWAVMWISTRAHILAALFYLLAMTATLWFSRTEKNKFLPAFVIIICSILSLFSKESGITLIASIIILLIYEKVSLNLKGKLIPPSVFLFGGIFLGFAIYLILRSQSGAVTVSVGADQWYSYVPSIKLFFDNLSRYAWRTYGLLSLIAAMLGVSLFINKRKINFHLITKNEFLLSFSLFIVMLAPFILLTGRSGIYTYLPGIAASLLLGAFARSIYSRTGEAEFSAVSQVPVFAVIIAFTAFTIGQSQKWVRMAETNMTVLDQIAAYEPRIPPDTSVVVEYPDFDPLYDFPSGFATWSFASALRLKYDDQKINGILNRQNEPLPPGVEKSINFLYKIENGKPKILRKPQKLFEN